MSTEWFDFGQIDKKSTHKCGNGRQILLYYNGNFRQKTSMKNPEYQWIMNQYQSMLEKTMHNILY